MSEIPGRSRDSQYYEVDFTHVDNPGSLRRILILEKTIHASCAVNLSVKELGAMSENNLTWITLEIRPTAYERFTLLLLILS